MKAASVGKAGSLAFLTAGSRNTANRGYARLYQQEILQADEGCDFGFLRSDR